MNPKIKLAPALPKSPSYPLSMYSGGGLGWGSDLRGISAANLAPFLICIIIATCCAHLRADDTPTSKPDIYVNHAGLVKLGWQLAAVGAPFQDRSLPDMIDLLHSLNIHHIQLSPQQAQKLDADGTAALINKLKSVKMDIVSMGPIEFGPSEADARPSFELARKLKMKTIVAYADDSSLEMLDKLANEYHVNVAIRNQPKPAGHWDPDDLLKALDGRSNRVGACADVAAWRASGSVPAQCVKKLAGHVLEIHLTSFDDSDSALALGELHKQKFKGICAIECKPGTNAVQQFAHNVTEFSKIVRELSGAQ